MRRYVALLGPLALLNCASYPEEYEFYDKVFHSVADSQGGELADIADGLAYSVGEGKRFDIFLCDRHSPEYTLVQRARLSGLFDALRGRGLSVSGVYLEGIYDTAEVDSIRDLAAEKDRCDLFLVDYALQRIRELGELERSLRAADGYVPVVLRVLVNAVDVEIELYRLILDVGLSHGAGSIAAPGLAYFDVITAPVFGLEDPATYHVSRYARNRLLFDDAVGCLSKIRDDLVSTGVDAFQPTVDRLQFLIDASAKALHAYDDIPDDVKRDCESNPLFYLNEYRTREWFDEPGEGVNIVIGGAFHAPEYSVLVAQNRVTCILLPLEE